jgi:hypothetical protein
MRGKISPGAIGRRSDANNARQKPPAPETAASKLVRKRELFMLARRYLENSGFNRRSGSRPRSAPEKGGILVPRCARRLRISRRKKYNWAFSAPRTAKLCQQRTVARGIFVIAREPGQCAFQQ